MKIRLIIGKISQYGGAENVGYRFAKFLLNENLLEEVVCFRSQVEDFGGKLTKLRVLKPGRFLKTYSFNRAVLRYLKEKGNKHVVNFAFSRVEGCDVFRAGGGTHLGFLKKSINAYKGFKGIKKRITRALNPINYYMPLLERRVFTHSKRIIAISEQVKEEIVEVYGRSLEEKIVVIPNSVDLERFNPALKRESRDVSRRKLNLKDSDYVLGFASSNFKLKGLDYVIKALPKLPSNVVLIVAGGRNPKKYERLAEKVGVRDRVVFLGKVSQMELFYSALDCLVHPSFYDTFANVVAEALAMHIPVVASMNTGAKDLIVEGKNGFVLRRVNESEIADCVKKTMSMKPEFPNNLVTDERVFNLYLKEAERCLP